MENIDKGLTVSKWVLIKLVENTPNAQKFICPIPKVWDFDEKRLHRASIVREFLHLQDFARHFLMSLFLEIEAIRSLIVT